MHRRLALATATTVLALMGLAIYEHGPDDQVVEVAGETPGQPSVLAAAAPLDRAVLTPPPSAAAPTTTAPTTAAGPTDTSAVATETTAAEVVDEVIEEPEVEADAATEAEAEAVEEEAEEMEDEAIEPVLPPPATVATTVARAGSGTLCVGDSIMLGASPGYYGSLQVCDVLDAAVSRQLREGVAIVSARLEAGRPSAAVIALGTNGTVTAADIDAILSQLVDVPRVVLVTVQLNGTRSWGASVNAQLVAAPGRWPNVSIADWKSASEGHSDWFSADGIHPNATGSGVFAGVITSVLGQ